jgi:hypothetical protein
MITVIIIITTPAQKSLPIILIFKLVLIILIKKHPNLCMSQVDLDLIAEALRIIHKLNLGLLAEVSRALVVILICSVTSLTKI